MIRAVVERALRPQPLSRQSVVDGIRRCYGEAGLPWHGRVVWTPSPRAELVNAGLTPRRRFPRRRPPPGPDRTWAAIEDRFRRPWAAVVPVGVPGILLDDRHDPLARVRSVVVDRALPRDRFDGAFDGRLILMQVVPAPTPDDPMLRAFVDACGAGPWWPRREVTVVSEPPTELHTEQVGELTYRLHHADGPAVRWADGSTAYRFHGVEVPSTLIESGWHGGTIHRHPNSEVRRAGIERIGWARYIAEAGWRLVASVPDPGNGPHRLDLYEDPSGREGVRVLVMTNGSPDRSGALRRYAEAVPARFDDPVDAAAWQYGCPARVYRHLRRRT